MTEDELVKAQSDLIRAQQSFISSLPHYEMHAREECGMGKASVQEEEGKGMTLSEYAREFMKSKEITAKRSTVASYYWILDRHILPTMGDVELDAINNRRLQEFADEKLKGLAKKTVRDIVGLVKNIMNDAAINEIIEPRAFTIKYPKNDRPDYRVLSEEEFEALEGYLMKISNPRAIGELLMLEAGIRIGEMCGLKWGDIDFSDMTVRVRRTVSRIYDPRSGTSELNIGSTKTDAGTRDIPVSERICRHLEKYKKEDEVFVASGKEMPTEPRTHRQWHDRQMRKVGISGLTPHGMRHTFATRAIRHGVDPKTVSAILGHSNSNITLNIYTSVTDEMLRKGIEKMEQKEGEHGQADM